MNHRENERTNQGGRLEGDTSDRRLTQSSTDEVQSRTRSQIFDTIYFRCCPQHGEQREKCPRGLITWSR
ncbi:hypothetical protein ACOMHN_016154 [Nucella lapillus]